MGRQAPGDERPLFQSKAGSLKKSGVKDRELLRSGQRVRPAFGDQRFPPVVWTQDAGVALKNRAIHRTHIAAR